MQAGRAVCVDARCMLCVAHLCDGRSRPHVRWAEFMAALGTPCCSTCWGSCSSHRAHAMVSPGPAQAFMRPSRALAWPYRVVLTAPPAPLTGILASHEFC